MDETARFAQAAVQWAAGGENAATAAATVRDVAPGVEVAVLVEGASDRAALEAIAVRSGRDLAARGVSIVPLGGATSIGRFLDLLGPKGLRVRLAGLCDAGEERYVRRALERAGFGSGNGREQMAELGFFVCDDDLEDELIRSLGVAAVEQIIDAEGDLRRFRTFQNQPAQRDRRAERQLRRFMGTTSGRKIHYARALADALDPERLPEPLGRLHERL